MLLCLSDTKIVVEKRSIFEGCLSFFTNEFCQNQLYKGWHQLKLQQMQFFVDGVVWPVKLGDNENN